DQNRRTASFFKDTFDSGARRSRASRVIRIGDQNSARGGANGIQNLFQWKCQLLRAIWNLADYGAGHFRIEAIHGIRRAQQQNFVAIVDVGVDQHLNSFVGTVGKREVVWLYGEKVRQFLFHFVIFRIHGQAGFSQVFTKIFDHLWRSADGVLVEIEPQFIGPPARRRVVRRHPQHGFARLEKARWQGDFLTWQGAPPRSGHALPDPRRERAS